MTYQKAQRAAYYANRVGQVYGDFEVVQVSFDPDSRKQLWVMRCVHCGGTRVTRNGRDYVKRRNPGVCRCQRYVPVADRPAEAKTEEPRPAVTHHELYSRWLGVRSRCYNPDDTDFCNYGARGILMCDEWRTDFWSFAEWAYKNGYFPGLTIDRVNNDLGYCPDNCRWVPRSHQNRNKRNVPLYNGLTIPQICEKERVSYSSVKALVNRGEDVETAVETARGRAESRKQAKKCRLEGISVSTVRYRMDRGTSFEEAVARNKDRMNSAYYEYRGERKILTEWAREYGVSPQTVKYRIEKMGLTLEQALTKAKDKRGRPKKRK